MANGNGTYATQDEKGKLWLYPNKYKKSDKHPSKTGPVEISKLALRKIVEAAKETDEDVVKMRCASWERTSKQGNQYTFVTFEPEQRREDPVAANSDAFDAASEDEEF